MTRRAIAVLALLVALPTMGIATAGAKQGADDPAGHVRHSGKDDGVRANKARVTHRHRTRHHEAGDDHGRRGHGRDD